MVKWTGTCIFIKSIINKAVKNNRIQYTNQTDPHQDRIRPDWVLVPIYLIIYFQHKLYVYFFVEMVRIRLSELTK